MYFSLWMENTIPHESLIDNNTNANGQLLFKCNMLACVQGVK